MKIQREHLLTAHHDGLRASFSKQEKNEQHAFVPNVKLQSDTVISAQLYRKQYERNAFSKRKRVELIIAARVARCKA